MLYKRLYGKSCFISLCSAFATPSIFSLSVSLPFCFPFLIHVDGRLCIFSVIQIHSAYIHTARTIQISRPVFFLLRKSRPNICCKPENRRVQQRTVDFFSFFLSLLGARTCHPARMCSPLAGAWFCLFMTSRHSLFSAASV